MAEATSFKTGIGCGLYRNTGTFGTPTWTLVDEVQSVTPTQVWEWVEATSRASAAKLFGKSTVDLTHTVVMRADDEDAGWEAFHAAAVSRTTVMDLLVLNGLISVEGVRGVRAEFLVSLDSEPQEINGSVFTTYTIKPTMTSNGYPRSVIMGASSTPSYTAYSV